MRVARRLPVVDAAGGRRARLDVDHGEHRPEGRGRAGAHPRRGLRVPGGLARSEFVIAGGAGGAAIVVVVGGGGGGAVVVVVVGGGAVVVVVAGRRVPPSSWSSPAGPSSWSLAMDRHEVRP